MTDTKQITIGTRVAFKRAFLQSTAQHPGWVPFARGVVVDAIVTVKWDDRQRIAGEPNPPFSCANVNNLVREDQIHLGARVMLKNHIDMKPVQHRLDEHRRRLQAARPGAEAADPRKQCDCCGQFKLTVERCWTGLGIETFACNDCRGGADE